MSDPRYRGMAPSCAGRSTDLIGPPAPRRIGVAAARGGSRRGLESAEPADVGEVLVAEQPKLDPIPRIGRLGVQLDARVLEELHGVGSARAVPVLPGVGLAERRAEHL